MKHPFLAIFAKIHINFCRIYFRTDAFQFHLLATDCLAIVSGCDEHWNEHQTARERVFGWSSSGPAGNTCFVCTSTALLHQKQCCLRGDRNAVTSSASSAVILRVSCAMIMLYTSMWRVHIAKLEKIISVALKSPKNRCKMEGREDGLSALPIEVRAW